MTRVLGAIVGVVGSALGVALAELFCRLLNWIDRRLMMSGGPAIVEDMVPVPDRNIDLGTAMAALEDWKNAHKSRWVEIEHDDGYGSSCWCVTIGVSGNDRDVPSNWTPYQRTGRIARAVYAYEGVGVAAPTGAPNEVHAGSDTGDWAGLAATIRAALQRAKELGL